MYKQFKVFKLKSKKKKSTILPLNGIVNQFTIILKLTEYKIYSYKRTIFHAIYFYDNKYE